MADKVKIWYDKEADYLEVLFEAREGYFQETENEAVMEKLLIPRFYQFASKVTPRPILSMDKRLYRGTPRNWLWVEGLLVPTRIRPLVSEPVSI